MTITYSRRAIIPDMSTFINICKDNPLLGIRYTVENQSPGFASVIWFPDNMEPVRLSVIVLTHSLVLEYDIVRTCES